jgi:hypothetical protein
VADAWVERFLVWLLTRRKLFWVGVIAALVFLIIIICGYLFGWKWTGLPNQTLWAWLQLLIIPAVLAGVGLWFNRQQRERELEIAERRAQDEALQAYLDKMTELLVVHKLGKPEEGDNVRTVAWARTKTVLRRLDSSNPKGAVHKGAVLRFLNEAQLIMMSCPVIRNLSGADLRGANLVGSYLKDVALRGANLSGANLSGANLSGANLSRSEDTKRATDLTDAELSGADLSGADLSGATVTKEQLAQASSLEGATMPDGQTLKGKLNPDEPTFEEWLKSREEGDSATPEQRGPWWGGPYHRPWWRRMFDA